jgi:DNA-binding MarR family transcriptional regulator
MTTPPIKITSLFQLITPYRLALRFLKSVPSSGVNEVATNIGLTHNRAGAILFELFTWKLVERKRVREGERRYYLYKLTQHGLDIINERGPKAAGLKDYTRLPDYVPPVDSVARAGALDHLTIKSKGV